MGPNLMSPGNRNRVIEVARRTVAEQLPSPATASSWRTCRKVTRGPSAVPMDRPHWPDWRALRTRGASAR